jgi:DNA-binding SARP family transcriptional activator
MEKRPQLRLLGPPVLHTHERESPALRRTVTALLAYLALEQAAQGRDTLSTALSPESGQSQARANLRHGLFTIRAALGSAVVFADQDTLRLDDRYRWPCPTLTTL